MNYIEIDINDKKIGLKFGMASYRYLSEKFKDGVSFHNEQITELGIAHIIYCAYKNNCIVKEMPMDMTFEQIVDFVEMNTSNTVFMDQMREVMKIWAESDFIKKTQVAQQDNEEPKKKKFRGTK